jgi:hypothetical protein
MAIGRPSALSPDVGREKALGLRAPERAAWFEAAVRQAGDPLDGLGIDGDDVRHRR